MRLLHVIGSMDPASGGPCQGIRNSNPEMERMGVYREVVSLDSPDSDWLGIDDFPVHALGPAKGVWRYSGKLIPWLIENLGRFDVVIVNGLWIFSSFAGWKALRILKKKDVAGNASHPRMFVMPHGMLDPYFQHAPDRKIKALRNLFYWKFIEKRIINDATGVLFTCETELLLARKTFSSYHPKKEINVGYGIVAPPEFRPEMYSAFVEKCPGIKGKPYLLFLSRIHNKKGVDMLLKAYASILDTGDSSYQVLPKLVIAGPGENTPYGKVLKNMVGSSPRLQEMVFFPGMITGDAKWGALYQCDAFVLPSHQENFGIAVVEAMACKKPVMITNQVNIWREIKNGGAGIIVDDSLSGTLEMLRQCIDMPASQKEIMGTKAYDVYRQHFHIKTAALSFYNAVNADN